MILVQFLGIILVIALIGFVVWLVTNYIKMPEPFKQLIIAIGVILIVLYIILLVTNQIPIMPKLR